MDKSAKEIQKWLEEVVPFTLLEGSPLLGSGPMYGRGSGSAGKSEEIDLEKMSPRQRDWYFKQMMDETDRGISRSSVKARKSHEKIMNL